MARRWKKTGVDAVLIKSKQKATVIENTLNYCVQVFNDTLGENETALDPELVFDTIHCVGDNLGLFVERNYHPYSYYHRAKKYKALYSCFVGNPDEMTWTLRNNGAFITTEGESKKVDYDYGEDPLNKNPDTTNKYRRDRKRRFLAENQSVDKLKQFFIVEALLDAFPERLLALLRQYLKAMPWSRW